MRQLAKSGDPPVRLFLSAPREPHASPSQSPVSAPALWGAALLSQWEFTRSTGTTFLALSRSSLNCGDLRGAHLPS